MELPHKVNLDQDQAIGDKPADIQKSNGKLQVISMVMALIELLFFFALLLRESGVYSLVVLSVMCVFPALYLLGAAFKNQRLFKVYAFSVILKCAVCLTFLLHGIFIILVMPRYKVDLYQAAYPGTTEHQIRLQFLCRAFNQLIGTIYFGCLSGLLTKIVLDFELQQLQKKLDKEPLV